MQALPPLQLAPLGGKASLPPLSKPPLQPLQPAASKATPDSLTAPASSRQSSFSFAANSASSNAAATSKQQLPETVPVARQTPEVSDLKSKALMSSKASDDMVSSKKASLPV